VQVSGEGLRRGREIGAWEMKITFLGVLVLAGIAIALIAIINQQNRKDPGESLAK